MTIDDQIKALQDSFHDHSIDDEARFRKIFDMLEVINVKMDSQTTVLDEIRPYVQGIAGLSIVWKGLMAIGGLLVIWASIKGLFLK